MVVEGCGVFPLTLLSISGDTLCPCLGQRHFALVCVCTMRTDTCRSAHNHTRSMQAAPEAHKLCITCHNLDKRNCGCHWTRLKFQSLCNLPGV